MRADIRTCCSFLFSAFVRLIGVGIFNTLFNLYFIDNGLSGSFLGIFLAVGNVSMALSSYPIGALIDRVAKKKILILFTLMGGVCYFLQILTTNRIVLLCISVFFGIAFIGLVNVTGPFLYQFSKISSKINLYLVYKFVNIIAITIGAFVAGFLREKQISVRTILFISVFLFLFSIFPQFFLKNPQSSEPVNYVGNHHEFAHNHSVMNTRGFFFQGIVMIILFFIIGFSPMLANYVNLYLRNRILIGEDMIAYGYAGIYFFSGFLMLFFAAYKIKSEKIALHLLCIGAVVPTIYFIMYKNTSFFVQIICIMLMISIFELFYSVLNDYIFTVSDSRFHGKYSGLINMISNFSETIGIVLCGRLLGQARYLTVFLYSSFSVLVIIPVALMLFVDQWRNKSMGNVAEISRK